MMQELLIMYQLFTLWGWFLRDNFLSWFVSLWFLLHFHARNLDDFLQIRNKRFLLTILDPCLWKYWIKRNFNWILYLRFFVDIYAKRTNTKNKKLTDIGLRFLPWILEA